MWRCVTRGARDGSSVPSLWGERAGASRGRAARPFVGRRRVPSCSSGHAAPCDKRVPSMVPYCVRPCCSPAHRAHSMAPTAKTARTVCAFRPRDTRGPCALPSTTRPGVVKGGQALVDAHGGAASCDGRGEPLGRRVTPPGCGRRGAWSLRRR